MSVTDCIGPRCENAELIAELAQMVERLTARVDMEVGRECEITRQARALLEKHKLRRAAQ